MFARIAASASNVTGRIGLRAIRTSKAAKLVADASRSSTSSAKTAATPSPSLNPAHAPNPVSRIPRIRLESNAILAGAQRCLSTVNKSDPLCLTSVSDTCETPAAKITTPKVKVKKTTRWADEVPESTTLPVSVLAEVKKVKKSVRFAEYTQVNCLSLDMGGEIYSSRLATSDYRSSLARTYPSGEGYRYIAAAALPSHHRLATDVMGDEQLQVGDICHHTRRATNS
ncbi:hypothetical protein SISSUDRAFT_1128398 [Sistotremastrum suecicum HHB10207 ss-3]|uniref:Uncharacterized protein n=1 Tax=Sistotremastrum suecicum HHB10207 ss-3 TaxID=1314776 RepID=A0A166DUV4_9AGAM|nr:hypothetical protein SISSUDRAFT_1128398 [Sistotremastrum suecicum HHB10207 ss-3]